MFTNPFSDSVTGFGYLSIKFTKNFRHPFSAKKRKNDKMVETFQPFVQKTAKWLQFKAESKDQEAPSQGFLPIS